MSHVIRTLGDLGAALTLAPERYHAGAMAAEGELRAPGAEALANLGARVVERRERAPAPPRRAPARSAACARATSSSRASART
jgi:hypothetical protein